MDKYTILRLQQYIICLFSSKSFCQIYANYAQFAVTAMAEYLNILQFRFWRNASSEIYRISQMSCSIRDMISGIAYFTRDRNYRRILKVITAEDADGIKRFQD